MTILARCVDIPARFAVGFAAYNENADGTYTVTENNAHAFPELYIRGYGWCSFEPTIASNFETASPLATATAENIRFTGIWVLSIIAFLGLAYLYLLPYIRELIFRRKVKNSDPAVAYSLVFLRLRDKFGFPNSETLTSTLLKANSYGCFKAFSNADEVIYNSLPPTSSQSDIVKEYRLTLKNLRKRKTMNNV
jgi:hypothetical protein